MSILLKGITAEELLDVFQWARTGANNCMIGHGIVATELPDHGDLIDKDSLVDKAEFIGDAFSGRGGFAVWGEDVVNAPVVIPAERSKNDEKSCGDFNSFINSFSWMCKNREGIKPRRIVKVYSG